MYSGIAPILLHQKIDLNSNCILIQDHFTILNDLIREV